MTRDIYGRCSFCKKSGWFLLSGDKSSYECEQCHTKFAVEINLTDFPDEQLSNLKLIRDHLDFMGEMFGDSAYHHESHVNHCRICSAWYSNKVW